MLQERVQAGKQLLDRASANIPNVLTAAPMLTAPGVHTRLEDQPQLCPFQSILGDAITREAKVQARDAAQRRATESAECMEANNFVNEDTDGGENAESAAQASGVQRTKLDGLFNTVVSEKAELQKKIKNECEDLCHKIKEFFEGSADANQLATDLGKGPVMMQEELNAKKKAADEYIVKTVEPAIGVWQLAVTEAKSVAAFMNATTEAPEIRKTMKGSSGKEFFAACGTTNNSCRQRAGQPTRHGRLLKCQLAAATMHHARLSSRCFVLSRNSKMTPNQSL